MADSPLPRPEIPPEPRVQPAQPKSDRNPIDWIMDHPKLAGFLALLALAITFSPKASVMGTWICLSVAEGFAIAMLAGFAKERSFPKPMIITTLASSIIGLCLLVFGFWLTGTKIEKYEVNNPTPLPPMIYSVPKPPTTLNKTPREWSETSQPFDNKQERLRIGDRLVAKAGHPPAISVKVSRASEDTSHQIDASSIANVMKGFSGLTVMVKGRHTHWQNELLNALQIVMPGAKDLGLFEDAALDFEGVKVYANEPPISAGDRGLSGAAALVGELKTQNFIANYFSSKEYNGETFEPNFIMVVVGNRN